MQKWQLEMLTALINCQHCIPHNQHRTNKWNQPHLDLLLSGAAWSTNYHHDHLNAERILMMRKSVSSNATVPHFQSWLSLSYSSHQCFICRFQMRDFEITDLKCNFYEHLILDSSWNAHCYGNFVSIENTHRLVGQDFCLLVALTFFPTVLQNKTILPPKHRDSLVSF